MLNLTERSIALEEYDPVSYFIGKPQKGDPAIITEHDGGIYHFASTANRDLFLAEPERYLPQYGGYCATAVSEGKTFGIDPSNYKLIDGKLYLFYRGELGDAKAVWDPEETTRRPKADEYWAQGNLPPA